jgi:hypothetical protein
MKYRIYDGYQMSYQDTPSSEFPCMRPTELRDADGGDVYECDILEGKDLRGVVEWEEWARRFVLRSGVETRPLIDAREFWVIGNAFEDPELLGA